MIDQITAYIESNPDTRIVLLRRKEVQKKHAANSMEILKGENVQSRNGCFLNSIDSMELSLWLEQMSSRV